MIPICITVIICVGFVCWTLVYIHDQKGYESLIKELTSSNKSITDKFEEQDKKLKEIELLAEDAKKQLTAHNVAQGFKIGK